MKLVHSLVNRVRARWMWSRGKSYFIIAKLDPVKIACGLSEIGVREN